MNEVSKYITIIRPEFMTFCQDACKAAALNHLLFRIAYKCKDQTKERIQAGDVLWYAKTELLTSEMSDAWGVCKVRKEVNDLVDMGLVGRTKDPTWGANRTKHFFFGSEQCQVFINLCEKHNICIVHLGLPAEVVHLIYSSNANDKSIKCSCPEDVANDKNIKCKSYIHQMETIDLSNANDKSIEAITEESIQKIPTEDTNKEEDTEAPQSDPTNDASATPSTPTLENTEYLPDLTSTENDSYSPEQGEDDANDRTIPDHRSRALPGAGSSVHPPVCQTAPGAQTDTGQTPTETVAEPLQGTDGYEKKEAAEQPALLIVEPGPLVLPAESAKWCARTAVTLSEVLRGKRYTADQEKNQLRAAQKMFTLFPDLTRAQFEPAFQDWAKWWRENDKGIFTLADLVAKKYRSNEIRLRSTLDRMEATQAPPVTTATEQPPSDEDAEREARNKRNKERSRKGAIAALQARIERNGKFQLYELKLMVEQFGMTLPPHLFSQYQASIPVHAQ